VADEAEKQNDHEEIAAAGEFGEGGRHNEGEGFGEEFLGREEFAKMEVHKKVAVLGEDFEHGEEKDFGEAPSGWDREHRSPIVANDRQLDR
jgi:hypothetical protein